MRRKFTMFVVVICAGFVAFLLPQSAYAATAPNCMNIPGTGQACKHAYYSLAIKTKVGAGNVGCISDDNPFGYWYITRYIGGWSYHPVNNPSYEIYGSYVDWQRRGIKGPYDMGGVEYDWTGVQCGMP